MQSGATNLTKRPDLGILIAIVAAVAIVSAILAGLAAVGGPDDARARRLDQAQLTTIQQIATSAQCAFAINGRTPRSLTELQSAPIGASLNEEVGTCRQLSALDLSHDSSITYEGKAGNRIEICAQFARASSSEDQERYVPYGLMNFPELRQTHPAGRHCYDIQLRAPSHLDNQGG